MSIIHCQNVCCTMSTVVYTKSYKEESMLLSTTVLAAFLAIKSFRRSFCSSFGAFKSTKDFFNLSGMCLCCLQYLVVSGIGIMHKSDLVWKEHGRMLGNESFRSSARINNS